MLWNALLALGLFVLHFVLYPFATDPYSLSAFGNFAQGVALVFAAIHFGRITYFASREDLPFYIQIALGFWIWVMAHALLAYSELLLSQPATGTVADAIWLVGYGLILRALYLMLLRQRGKRTLKDFVGVLVISATVLAVLWVPVTDKESSVLVKTEQVVFPVLDFLIAFVAFLLAREPRFKMWRIAGFGSLVIGITDLVFPYFETMRTPVYRYLDIPLFVGYSLWWLFAAFLLESERRRRSKNHMAENVWYLSLQPCLRIRYIPDMKAKRTPQRTRRIAFLAAPGAQILDVTGPFQVFFRASEIWRRSHPDAPAPYTVELISTTTNKLVDTSCGLGLLGNCTYRSLQGSVDTLLIAGGGVMESAIHDQPLLAWLRRTAKKVRRLGSICTGAFLLAEAGLLDGKRAVTHWRWCGELARRYRKIRVEADPIFIQDGKLYTSAGITAGMDLALALVEEDYGSELALQTAREMVLYLRRPGGQSQFSAALSSQIAHQSNLQKLHSWVLEHLNEALTVETLANRAAMSSRNFARVFSKETGTTPARFVEQLRLETARRKLEETKRSLDEVAADCGFGSAESMRRVFWRVLRVPPGEYRARFRRKVRQTWNKHQV